MKANTKALIFWTFCAVACGLTGLSSSQIVKCDYEENFPYSIKEINLNRRYYTCHLNTRNLDYGSKPMKIEGAHKIRKSDDDVKYVINYMNHVLQTFSSIFCDKFRNVEAIEASNMKLEFVDENSFQNCKNLKHLKLFDNNFRQLPANLLASNGQLRALLINENSKLSSLPDNFLVSQNQLEYLNLVSNSLSSLPSGIFSRLTKLKHSFDLDNNNLETIDPKWFENLQNVEKLRITSNKLWEVPANSFQSMKNLKTLRLRANRITTLHSDSFKGLGNLEVLSLHENQISDLPENVFTQLVSLTYLSLRSNKLTTIHADSLGSHPKLWFISVRDNRLSSIDEKVIDSTALTQVECNNNVCFNGVIKSRNDIKPQLATCFANYRPRNQAIAQQSRPQGVSQTTQPKARKDLTQRISTEQQPDGSCGRSTNVKGNIIGGSFLDKGTFPWLAVLAFPNGTYLCGGVLISKRKVLTAAHCMLYKRETVARLPRSFYVSLGTHDLNNPIDPDRATYAVQSINIHPEWNPGIEQWDADLAALYLAKDVTFTEFIQPICLIPAGSPAEREVNGTVVGYGRSEDETKNHENIPKVLDMPIIELLDCILKYPTWVKLVTRRTFCAGRDDSKGVCKGDSGGGLFVEFKNIYYLRGIISASLFDNSQCDVDSYSLFTDVQKYRPWIESVGGNPHFFNKK